LLSKHSTCQIENSTSTTASPSYLNRSV
jgi:hypothetical protein